jgi:enoyl-CoA hydratase
MAYECFDVSIGDGIAHIVMNRPEVRNNMNPAFWAELPQIVREIDADAQARVIVISSTGPHFCGGIDVSMFGTSADKDAVNPHAKRQSGLKISRYGEAHAGFAFCAGAVSLAGAGRHSRRVHWRRG